MRIAVPATSCNVIGWIEGRRALLVGVPAVAHAFSASLYSPCHHFIFGICDMALSSIITSSSC